MSKSWEDDPRFATHPDLRSARLWIMVALAFVSTIFLIRAFSNGKPAIRAGVADYSWKVSDLDGKTVDMSSYKGRAVFLNVWATWCPPCRAEMPSIARLAADPRLKDVAFLCVSVDGEPEPVRGYIAETKPPMTMLLARGPAPSIFETDGIPATFLIAPDGRITRSELGGMEWDTPDVVKLLEGMAQEAK